MSEQVQIINLGNRTFTFKNKDFGDAAVDTEDLLQVDINNILGDIITFPVLFNRIGVIKAEIDDLVREVQLSCDILEAQLRNEYRKSLIEIEPTAKGSKKVYPTEQEIKDATSVDHRYKVKKDYLNLVKKEADFIDSLYWSAKSKDKKLEAISMKLKPEDFDQEILEGSINSVVIRSHKNNFPTRSKS